MSYVSYASVDPRTFRLAEFLDVAGAIDLGFKPKMVVVASDTDRDDEGRDLKYRGTSTLKEIRTLPASSVRFESADLSTDLSWDNFGNIAFTGTDFQPRGFLDAICAAEGFLDASCGDMDDRMWQSTASLSTYASFGRSVEGLPRVWDPVWEREIIDISGNPGRDSGTAGVGLWPAADLWYGPGCVEFMDFAAVRTVPVGEVTELSNGVLHVHLFDVDTPEPEVRRRQQVLRDHLRFDELAARADEINLALRKRGEPVEG